MGVQQEEKQDFKSQFYNLQGIHINERKKNFYKLLHTTRFDIPQDQIDIQPRNYQETIFYVDVLIHFKKVDKLIEILQKGTGVLISKILKQQWFFRLAFEDMTEDDIVNKFLPSLSFSTRMKVLKKLSLALSEERMDKIFDLILERYGLFIAKQFMFGCSSEKIVHLLRNNEITLLSEQLKRLLQKNVELIKIYFEEYKKNTRTDFHDSSFLNYLIWKHPNLYFELQLNRKPNIKLGRCTSRAVVKSNEEDVLKDIQNYRLHKAALSREIKDFDKKCFLKFFPPDINNVKRYTYSSNLYSLLSKYPIKKRWEILSEAFQQAYKKEIVENLDHFDENLAKVFPKEIRQKWAEMQYLENNNADYIKYLNPKKASKLIKDKINVTSEISQRGRLLNELINVCYVHKDYSTYETVLKYICTRHRNDDINVRANMISFIGKHIDYEVITEDHWKYINEIIDIQRVRGESLPFEIIIEYLFVVYKKKLSLDEPITQFIKDCLKIQKSFRLWYYRKEPELERVVLKLAAKILPTLQPENDREFINENMSLLLSYIVDYNKDIKDNKTFKKDFKKLWIDLNDCPALVDLIKEVCSKARPYTIDDYTVINNFMLYNCLYSEYPLQVISDDHLLDIIKFMCNDEDKGDLTQHCMLEVIKTPKRNIFEETLLDYFFNRTNDQYTYYLKQSAVEHFIAKDPEVIADYFNQILQVEVKYNSDILNYNIIKRYSHLQLDEKIIEYFKHLVSINSNYENKVKLFKGLSKVMNTQGFLDLVKDYIPDEKKLNLFNEGQREKYKVQCDIVKDLKNLDEPPIVTRVLMDFCQGDYLQSSLPALYSTLYRIDEEKAFSYIKILGERAMSTRKHAIFLGFKLLSLKEAVALYSTISSKEKNISAKKYLFDSLLKFFVQNPIESLLDVIFKNMDFIDKNDSEMIQTLVQSVDKIPKHDAPLFFEKVWHFLDLLEEQEASVINHRDSLLNTINQYGRDFFLKLNKTFFQKVIKMYFLSSDNRLLKCSNQLDYLVINYLSANVDEQHFKFIFNIIKSYKDIHWRNNNKEYIKYIFRFFTSSYKKFDENETKFLTLFSKFWQQHFNMEESFSEHVLLGLMNLYKENKIIESFSQVVDQFLQELTGSYGPHIVYNEMVTNCIKNFFENIPSQSNTDFNLENFAYCLIKLNSSEHNCYVAFNIIKDFTSQKSIYTKVLDILQSTDGFTAKVYSNVLLKK